MASSLRRLQRPGPAALASCAQGLAALLKSSNSKGSERSRLPVAAKIAFEIAGAIAGTPGSPTPAGGWFDFTI